jgi:hypothetical protein
MANSDVAHSSPIITELRRPFSAETWRMTAYVILALPASIIAIPLAFVGRSVRLHIGLARAVLGWTEADGHRRGHRSMRGLLLGFVHAWCCLLLNYVGVVITIGVWVVAILNIAYPVRWLIGMGGPTAEAWGGPTFAGAWAFHALVGGVPCLFLAAWIVKGLASAQTRLLRLISLN